MWVENSSDRNRIVAPVYRPLWKRHVRVPSFVIQLTDYDRLFVRPTRQFENRIRALQISQNSIHWRCMVSSHPCRCFPSRRYTTSYAEYETSAYRHTCITPVLRFVVVVRLFVLHENPSTFDVESTSSRQNLKLHGRCVNRHS
jgi:hypothetical protein